MYSTSKSTLSWNIFYCSFGIITPQIYMKILCCRVDSLRKNFRWDLRWDVMSESHLRFCSKWCEESHTLINTGAYSVVAPPPAHPNEFKNTHFKALVNLSFFFFFLICIHDFSPEILPGSSPEKSCMKFLWIQKLSGTLRNEISKSWNCWFYCLES